MCWRELVSGFLSDLKSKLDVYVEYFSLVWTVLEPKVERNDDINPYWIEDKEIKKGPVAFLSVGENQFWKDLLEKYLYPIDEDKAEKVIQYLMLKCKILSFSGVNFLFLNFEMFNFEQNI